MLINRSEQGTSEQGTTVMEMLIVLTIISILLAQGAPLMKQFYQQQRVYLQTQQLVRFLHSARSEAILHGAVEVCSPDNGCRAISSASSLIARSLSGKTNSSTQQLPTLRFQTPDDIHISWRGFRGKTVTFHNSGIARYQNGHFLVCSSYAARKVILNWAGKTRTERVDHNALCPR